MKVIGEMRMVFEYRNVLLFPLKRLDDNNQDDFHDDKMMAHFFAAVVAKFPLKSDSGGGVGRKTGDTINERIEEKLKDE